MGYGDDVCLATCTPNTQHPNAGQNIQRPLYVCLAALAELRKKTIFQLGSD